MPLGQFCPSAQQRTLLWTGISYFTGASCRRSMRSTRGCFTKSPLPLPMDITQEEWYIHLGNPQERVVKQGSDGHGHKKIGSATGDVGSDDPEDAARARPAARVRHCAPYRAGESRRPSVE